MTGCRPPLPRKNLTHCPGWLDHYTPPTETDCGKVPRWAHSISSRSNGPAASAISVLAGGSRPRKVLAVRSTVGSGRHESAGWSRWRGVVTRTYRGIPLHLLGGPRSGGTAQAGQRAGRCAGGRSRRCEGGPGGGSAQAGWPPCACAMCQLKWVTQKTQPGRPYGPSGTWERTRNASGRGSVPAQARVDTGS